MTKVMWLAAVMLGVSSLALAHGPTRQKVTDSVVIKADPAKVWALVGDFNATPQWDPEVEKSTVSAGNSVDSKRTLALRNGATMEDAIESRDDATMTLHYRTHVPGKLPVTNYTAMLKVQPGEAPGTAVVEWRSAFYRIFPGPNPPPDQTDEAASKAVADKMHAALAHLKEVLEK